MSVLFQLDQLPVLVQFGELFGPNLLPVLLVLAGLVLSIMEALAPGANLIVVGVALLAAGLLGLLLGPIAGPFVLGIAVLVFGAIAFTIYRDLGLYETSEQQTTDSGDLKGGFATVTERVTPQEGEVKVDDGGFNPYYSARSMDEEIPEGTEVMVIDPGGGNVLTVVPVEGGDAIDRELARGREAETVEELQAELQEEEAAGDDGTTDTSDTTTDASDDTDEEREPERN